MKPIDAVKLFGLNNLAIEAEIRRVEKEFDVELGHTLKEKVEEDEYFPQFSSRLRSESNAMARHYAIFYCLENSIRTMISEQLEDAFGANWWIQPDVVPLQVNKNCEENRKRERESGFTPRSEYMIDYTTFGELGDILRQNWDYFGGTFRDQKAVNKILAALNTLRGPIAHCKPLAADEIVRLHLAMKDWFRQLS